MTQMQMSTILKKYLDLESVQKIMDAAIEEALREHKQAGNKVPIWDNGQMVYVEPIKA